CMGISAQNTGKQFAFDERTRNLVPTRIEPSSSILLRWFALSGCRAALVADATANHQGARASVIVRRGASNVWVGEVVAFCPSTKPALYRPRRNASTTCEVSSGDLALRKPMTGIAGCCARAASG